MNNPVSYNEYAAKALEILTKGAFLTVKAGETVNTMTIGWGSLGFMWSKPVFTVMVRRSRYTYDLIERSQEFTVSLPFADLTAALKICGSQSGRDLDKFAAAGLKTTAGQQVSPPIINCPGLHYECRIIYKQPLAPAALDGSFRATCYPSPDYHTLYYGEIVASYLVK